MNAPGMGAQASQPSGQPSAGNSDCKITPAVQSWLEQLAQGDMAAFWEIWSLYQAQLFRICLRYMGNLHADAEDALSQVREKARTALPLAAAGVRNPKSWLARVAVNLCIDIQRRHRPVVHFEEWSCSEIEDLRDEGSLPGDRLALHELKATIDQAIQALPALVRCACILYFLEERTYEQISQELHISQANARKRIQQGRGILKQSIHYKDHFSFRIAPAVAPNPVNRMHFYF
jgi:RNA polymerase sigma factor (sigma-70 family)